jgi:hypothetical protein
VGVGPGVSNKALSACVEKLNALKAIVEASDEPQNSNADQSLQRLRDSVYTQTPNPETQTPNPKPPTPSLKPRTSERGTRNPKAHVILYLHPSPELYQLLHPSPELYQLYTLFRVLYAPSRVPGPLCTKP